MVNRDPVRNSRLVRVSRQTELRSTPFDLSKSRIQVDHAPNPGKPFAGPVRPQRRCAENFSPCRLGKNNIVPAAYQQQRSIGWLRSRPVSLQELLEVLVFSPIGQKHFIGWDGGERPLAALQPSSTDAENTARALLVSTSFTWKSGNTVLAP